LRKLSDILLVLLISIPLFILTLPIILVSLPFTYLQRKRFEKRYTAFLAENDRKNFFCYNNRKNSKKYIEEYIIPNLEKGIEIVYLNGRKIESESNAQFISAALHGLKYYNKFPHLMKIRNGQLIDKSINNPFYGVLNMKKSKTELVNKINLFFELNTIKKGV